MIADLVARLEKASGPDRELDADIAIAVFATVNTEDDLVYARKRSPGNDATHPGHYFIKSRSGAQAHSAPHYTASVDAALTLVPEGWRFDISNRAPTPHAGRAYIHNGELIYAGVGGTRNPRYQAFENTAASPAIAICIAALRARASQATEEVG
jgi:hypothetical protein